MAEMEVADSCTRGPPWSLKNQLNRRRADGPPGPGSPGGGDAGPAKRSGGRRSLTGASLVHKLEQHYSASKGETRDFLGLVAQEFDKVMTVMLHGVRDTVFKKMDAMDAQLTSVERNSRRLLDKYDERNRLAMEAAQRTADAEREEKAVLCQWLNGFLVSVSAEPHLSPMDFTLARFALNISMAASKTPPHVMLEAGVHSFLVSMLSSPNELVTGPAAMALSQLSLHRECQHALGLAGGIPPLVFLCFTNKSPAVLVQACNSLALLSQYPPNKSTVASKGGIAGMVHLLAGFGKEERVSLQVVGQALACLVNALHNSDANRGLVVECGIMPPLVPLMGVVDDDYVLTQACRTVANVAFGNHHNALHFLEAGTDRVISDVMESTDKSTHSDLAEAALVALANLSNTGMNQALVGSGQTIELAVSVCRHCASPRVVRNAAMAICALCFKCHANKTRCADAGAVPLLLGLARSWGISGDQDGASSHGGGGRGMQAAEMALCALTILMQHPTNALIMRDIRGVRQLVELIHTTEHNGVLTAASMAVVALIPEPDTIVRTWEDGREGEMEAAGGRQALVRCREWVYGRKPAPLWLAYGLDVLGCTPEELQRSLRGGGKPFHLPEFFHRSAFFWEVVTRIPPDVTITSSVELGGMLFHVF